MAVERVEINEPVEGEQMSLEDQLAQQEAENPALKEQEEPTQREPSGQDNNNEENPDWLPKKFKTPEELAKAYTQLEKERGKASEPNNKEQQEEAPQKTVAPLSDAIQQASDAFYKEGELSEDNIKALEENGIPREFVDAYVKGQQATMDAEVESIRASVGGQENYDAMVDWASDNLSAAEIDAFDQMVTSGSAEATKMAVKGLYARYTGESGESGVNIAKGGTSKAAVQPFNSSAHVVEAINDRRYQNDPAYRAEVERRIAASPNI
jgi:hypothetical protein